MKQSAEIILDIIKKIKDDSGSVHYLSLEDSIVKVLMKNQYGKGYKEGQHSPEHNTLNLCVKFGLMNKVTDKRVSFEKQGYWVNQPYLNEFINTWLFP